MAQKKYSAFSHASHNLQAHSLLKENGGFRDWEITTAFYASMKFLEGSLFSGEYKRPSTDNVVEYKSYNEYRSAFNRFVGGAPHDAMKHFVRNNTNDDIWLSYKELYNLCHDSRYKNYNIEEGELEIAQQDLDAIKKYCIDNQK